MNMGTDNDTHSQLLTIISLQHEQLNLMHQIIQQLNENPVSDQTNPNPEDRANHLLIMHYQMQQLQLMYQTIEQYYKKPILHHPADTIPQPIPLDPQNQTINPINAAQTPSSRRRIVPIIDPRAKILIINGQHKVQIRVDRRNKQKYFYPFMSQQDALNDLPIEQLQTDPFNLINFDQKE